MASGYVLHEVCRGQYRFTLTSRTGQLLLTSGLYMDKESALRKIDTTRQLARNSTNYDLLTAEGGGLYFVVVTRKGEVLAYSATYPNAEERQTAINLVKSNNRGARLEDLTQDLAGKQEGLVPSGRFAAVQTGQGTRGDSQYERLFRLRQRIDPSFAVQPAGAAAGMPER